MGTEPERRSDNVELPEGLTPDKLRSIANWFDTYDVIIERVIFTMGGDDVLDGERLIAVRGKDVQVDLRRWADAIEAQTGRRPNDA